MALSAIPLSSRSAENGFQTPPAILERHIAQRKAAAFGWALRTKRAHDDVSIGLERIFYRGDITFSLLGFDQKVENSPIMPNIVETRG
jgi:hypothetical protein